MEENDDMKNGKIAVDVEEDDLNSSLRIGSTGAYTARVDHEEYDPFEDAGKSLEDLALGDGMESMKDAKDFGPVWKLHFYKGVQKGLVSWLSHREDDRSEWRVKLGNFLESKYVEITLALLLFFDICVVIAEIVLVDVACRAGEEREEDFEHAEEALHYTSIAILSLFCVDLLFTFVAHDFGIFRHFGYVIDVIVIPTSLILELLISDVGGLLILLRLWRIIRVIHGASEILHEVERDLARRKIRKQIREVEEYYVGELEDKDNEIHSLRTSLAEKQQCDEKKEL